MRLGANDARCWSHYGTSARGVAACGLRGQPYTRSEGSGRGSPGRCVLRNHAVPSHGLCCISWRQLAFSRTPTIGRATLDLCIRRSQSLSLAAPGGGDGVPAPRLAFLATCNVTGVSGNLGGLHHSAVRTCLETLVGSEYVQCVGLLGVWPKAFLAGCCQDAALRITHLGRHGRITWTLLLTQSKTRLKPSSSCAQR